jgi:hypothetical protein
MSFTNYHDRGYKSLLSESAIDYLDKACGLYCVYCGQTCYECGLYGCEDI